MKRMYKSCLVPGCTNTTIKTPNKLFVSVPKRPLIRKVWLKLARRNPHQLADDSTIFLCEDHFDMQKEMANYYQYKMGLSKKILMVNGVVPSKFPWQEDSKKLVCDANTFQHAFVEQQRSKHLRHYMKFQPESSTRDVSEFPLSTTEALETFDESIPREEKILKKDISSSFTSSTTERQENTNSPVLQEEDAPSHKVNSSALVLF